MKKAFVLALLLGLPPCLVMFSSGCRHTQPKPARPLPPGTGLAVPKVVSAPTYELHRQTYDALPLADPQRPHYRRVLATHLRAEALRALEQRDFSKAFDDFSEMATLHDPARVYAGTSHDPDLASLARKITKAFSPRGDASRVIPALAVQISLAKDKQTLQHTYWRVLHWIDDASVTLDGKIAQGRRAIAIVERTLFIWPSQLVLRSLKKLYLERMEALSKLQPSHLFGKNGRFAFPVQQWTGYRIARMFLWVDRPDLAAESIRSISPNRDGDGILALVQHTFGKSPKGVDSVRLATALEGRDPRVALRICRKASERFPRNPEVHACVGQLAARMQKTQLSVLAYEAASKLEPANRDYAEKLANQYQHQLFTLIEQEQVDFAEVKLRTIERFYARANRRYGKPLTLPLSRVYYALGFGQYNAGRIDGALRNLQKSLDARTSPEALVQLATIYLKSGDPKTAEEYLRRLSKLRSPTAAQRLYWRARAAGLEAQRLTLIKASQEATAALNKASRLWTRWLSLDLPPEARAEANIRKARVLYALGHKVAALDTLDQAIDAAPARKETYADVIAMLTTYGHLPEALDAYHRALGRPEVTEYLKSYCSFWVIDLARRAGQPPDPLALNYLGKLSGDQWYHQLAGLVLGRISFDKLKPLARSSARQAELYFYHAEQLLAKGDVQQARKLWQKVVNTNMMAFFEFDMAQKNLRAGPATVATQPVDRKLPRRRTKRKPSSSAPRSP